MSSLVADTLKTRLGAAVSFTDDIIVVGYATVTQDLQVEGDLNITGDLSYDEVTGTNINITGIGTFGTLGVTGIGTFGTLGVSIATTSKDLEVTGVTTTPVLHVGSGVTVGAGITLNSSGMDVVGVVTATSFEGSGALLTGLPAGFTELDAMLFN